MEHWCERSTKFHSFWFYFLSFYFSSFSVVDFLYKNLSRAELLKYKIDFPKLFNLRLPCHKNLQLILQSFCTFMSLPLKKLICYNVFFDWVFVIYFLWSYSTLKILHLLILDRTPSDFSCWDKSFWNKKIQNLIIFGFWIPVM